MNELISQGKRNKDKQDQSGSSDESDSDQDFGIGRWQGKRTNELSVIGGFTYIKDDKVRSSDFPICIASVFMIAAPSLLYLIVILPQTFTWYGSVIVGIIYVASLVANFAILLKCSLTDPGIIPSIKSSNINKDKYYYVKYDDKLRTSQNDLMTGEEFYDQACYQLLPPPPAEGDKEEFYKQNNDAFALAFCRTCQILRPPRSFHCKTCNICIEQHDHHCPWVGTCIGKRNHRYFSMFLFWTSIHALLTCALTLVFFIQTYQNQGKVDVRNLPNVLTIFLFTYSGIFFVTLIGFWCYQNCLILDNVTSNEHLRRNWNGSKHRKKQLENAARPSILQRMRYFYFSELPPSRVQAYFKIKKNENTDDQLQQLNNEGSSITNLKSINNEAVLREYGIIMQSEELLV
ncbi:dhhc-type zinc finger family protein [Stylonychia lemnae]|uniref:Palmitoyltransferase n=1 Tax=Stylonychia lemnae TaxID=5949 RepID=A0A078AY24_STYLE|nr:dhhc-type zinc finger family protein [Stylonychia lemnae]|eukprot:CDW85688.1 dhhc-type zinc finger family protein [Stylonychia lemnae]